MLYEIKLENLSIDKRVWFSIKNLIVYQLIIICSLLFVLILNKEKFNLFFVFSILEIIIMPIIIQLYLSKRNYLVYILNFTDDFIEIKYYYRYFHNKYIKIKISDLNYRYYKRQYSQFGTYWTLELFKNGKYIIQISEKDNIGWTQEKMLNVKNQLDILKVSPKEFTFW